MWKPRSEAILFRVWQHANACGWECTVGEAAIAIGESPHIVGGLVKRKGWAQRFRASPTSRFSERGAVRALDFNVTEFGLPYHEETFA